MSERFVADVTAPHVAEITDYVRKLQKLAMLGDLCFSHSVGMPDSWLVREVSYCSVSNLVKVVGRHGHFSSFAPCAFACDSFGVILGCYPDSELVHVVPPWLVRFAV